MGASWLIGVCISLVSSTIVSTYLFSFLTTQLNIGVNMQKYSHLQDQQKPIERRTPPWRVW